MAANNTDLTTAEAKHKVALANIKAATSKKTTLLGDLQIADATVATAKEKSDLASRPASTAFDTCEASFSQDVVDALTQMTAHAMEAKRELDATKSHAEQVQSELTVRCFNSKYVSTDRKNEFCQVAYCTHAYLLYTAVDQTHASDI